MSDGRSVIRSVMTYWCRIGCSGTETPARAPTFLAHCPAQLTTFSQRISPAVVLAPTTRPLTMSKPVTATPSNIRAPCMRAPRASDCVRSDGLAWPSDGTNVAPIRSPASRIGQRDLTSCGPNRCMSRPKLRAVVACRLNSINRSAERASRRQPDDFQPVAKPVSVSSSEYSWTE